MSFHCQEQVGGFATELAYRSQKTSIIIPDDTLNDTVNGTVNDTVNKDRFGRIFLCIPSFFIPFFLVF